MKIRLRFSLRTLLVLVTLTCIYFAAWEVTKRLGVRDISDGQLGQDVRSPVPFVVGASFYGIPDNYRIVKPIRTNDIPRALESIGLPPAEDLSARDAPERAELIPVNDPTEDDSNDDTGLIGPVQIEFLEGLDVFIIGRPRKPVVLPSLVRRHFVWFFGWTWEMPIRWEVPYDLSKRDDMQ